MKLIILTGSLGSGKTTLLNNLITTLPEIRTSIIINEFAVIGVDKESVNEKVIEVNAGCVCCSKGEELIDSINKLQNTDLVLLETTGLASLNNLLEVLNKTKAKITNIVLVIDAYAYTQTKGLSKLTKEQIKNATTIIISKTDLVTKSTITEITKEIEGKEIILTKNGKITYDQLKKEHKIKINPKKISLIEKLIPELKIDKESKHIQKAGIKSISYETTKKINKNELENFIYSLPKQITRAKGLILDDNIYNFNYASGLFYIEPTKKQIQKSSIVLIGKMSRLQKIKYISMLDNLTQDKTPLMDKIKSFLE
jgi:G3E family GTPase